LVDQLERENYQQNNYILILFKPLSQKPHEQDKLQAEATAYAVCRHFGFEDLKSPNYLYLTGLKAEDLKASLTTISTLTQQIINQMTERIS